MVIPTKYKYLHGWADDFDRFIRVVKQTNKMDIEPDGAIVGLAHSLQENAALDGIDCIQLVHTHFDLDIYCTDYYLD